MFDNLIAAGATLVASEEHGHQLEVLGMPTWMFAIIGFIFFGILFAITVSFSGRGVARPEHTGGHLGADETAALNEYKSKHKH